MDILIKDSGERCVFSTGAVRDIQTGKGRCDLLPLKTLPVLRTFPFNYLDDFKASGDPTALENLLQVAKDKMFDQKWETMLRAVSKQFEEGAVKYGENNWQKGIPVKRYIDSAIRHYLKAHRGDTDENHDVAFVWNVLCAIWTCQHYPNLNDYAQEVNKNA